MEQKIKEQFSGFIRTPALWKERGFFDLKQFSFHFPVHTELLESATHIPELYTNFVLGKRMEIFFSHLLNNFNQFKVIDMNRQIFREKITLGELDFLVQNIHNNRNYHIELVYKFYLYDPLLPAEDRWIGPNRKDSLLQKISRLKTHQLPLLKTEECLNVLSEYGLHYDEFEQQVCFKASLFLPKAFKFQVIENLNPSCILGYWISFRDFSSPEYFSHQYYAPKKQDWPVDPSTNQEWKPYSEFWEEVLSYNKDNKSPLVWMKNESGGFDRFFVVWW